MSVLLLAFGLSIGCTENVIGKLDDGEDYWGTDEEPDGSGTDESADDGEVPQDIDPDSDAEEDDEVVEDDTAEDEIVEDDTAEDEIVEDDTAEDEVVEDDTAEDEIVEDDTADDEGMDIDTAGDEVADGGDVLGEDTADDVTDEDTADAEVDDADMDEGADDGVVVEDTAHDDVTEEDTADVEVEDDVTSVDTAVEDTDDEVADDEVADDDDVGTDTARGDTGVADTAEDDVADDEDAGDGEPIDDMDVDDSPEDTADGDSGFLIEDSGEPLVVPVVSGLELYPDPAYTISTLIATATVSDGASIAWSWTVDEVPIAPTSASLDGLIWFDKHNLVEVTAQPYLGDTFGEPATANITISNSPPDAPLVSIEPSDATAEESLRCVITGESSDLDTDESTYSATWKVDGYPYTATDTSFPGDTVPEGVTEAGQIWTCTVTPHDGDDPGSTASASVTIGDAPGLERVCTDELVSVGTPAVVETGRSAVGSWGPDHHIDGETGFWVFEDYDGDTIREYADLTTVGSGTLAATHELEEDWSGTGQLVFNGSVYYQEEDSGDLVRFDTSTGTEAARSTIPGAGIDADFDYAFGGRSSIDFDTDGEKLYVIHSSDAVGGRFQVTEVNPDTLAILSTQTAPAGMKTEHGNAFIACGVLYATDERFYMAGTIDYAWKIGTAIEWDPAIPWPSEGYFTAAQYSPVDNTIYAYDNGYLLMLAPSWAP